MDMSNKIISKSKNESGFTLIEAVAAIFVMTIALVGTAAAITYALEYSTLSRNATNAKLVISSMIEQVESLRNTRRLQFKQIANIADVDNTDAVNNFSGFLTGFREISSSNGPDGVDGTADDLLDDGADNTYGTADDFVNPALARGGFKREVVVTELSAFVKKVEIKVQYTASAGKIGELRGVCYLNNDSRLSRQ
jgi:type II secretory pathway pseudopilin PulG